MDALKSLLKVLMAVGSIAGILLPILNFLKL
jgi:hypothetical protein